ncbi:MAG TPA: GNAT family N-acetyltransferase [Acidimicrobiales bacterium]|nr:GNAT family N-acetyltransferase [Acidimicrobiales bacterium]
MGAQRGTDDHDRASVASAPAARGGRRGPGGPHVRPGGTGDGAFVAGLHAAGIADGFLSGLGPRFLAVLYRRIALDRDSFLLVAEDDAATRVGFVAGTCGVGRLYRSFLLHDGVRAAAAAPVRLARSWRHALETLRYGSGEDVSEAATPAGASEVELLSVAVVPAARGGGVGGALVGAFVDEVRSRGIGRAAVVVGASNASAVAMYRRAGFGGDEELEVHRGTPSLRLTWPAPSGGHQ